MHILASVTHTLLYSERATMDKNELSRLFNYLKKEKRRKKEKTAKQFIIVKKNGKM